MKLGLSARFCYDRRRRPLKEELVRQAIILLTLLAVAVPSHAGLEQAVSAVSAAFEAAFQAPSATLVPAFKRVKALNDDEDSLISLLSDRDASVRRTAAVSLKNYALQSWKTENALLERAKDSRELESVRREAVKSLAWAAQHWSTRDALLSLIREDHETTTLRAIALKSLYVVSNDDMANRTLIDALGSDQPLELREAALWALAGAATSNFDTKDKLRSIAVDGGETVAVRLEALKSLYAALGDWNLRDAVLRLAQDFGTAQAVRETSILALTAINQDWTVKDYLQRESQEERNSVLRTAAIRALANGPDLELVRYFHLSYYLGRFIDPLEDQ
jgi:hypothetical protein